MSSKPSQGPEVERRREQIEALMRKFRADPASRNAARPAEKCPKRLYHYASLPGVAGIISSSTIWASDARFMNDASELRYAADLIDSVVRRSFSRIEEGALTSHLPSYEGVTVPHVLLRGRRSAFPVERLRTRRPGRRSWIRPFDALRYFEAPNKNVLEKGRVRRSGARKFGGPGS
jgi:hypothetical protein